MDKRCKDALEVIQRQTGRKGGGIPELLETQRGKPMSLQIATPVLARMMPGALQSVKIETRVHGRGEANYAKAAERDRLANKSEIHRKEGGRDRDKGKVA